jgi:hypothetical protein
VALVLEHEVVDVGSLAAQLLDEIADRVDDGIVPTLDDEERARELVDVRPRRPLDEEAPSVVGSPTASAKYGFQVSGMRSGNASRS